MASKPIAGDVLAAATVAEQAHDCDTSRCCRKCRRHVDPYQGCLLR